MLRAMKKYIIDNVGVVKGRTQCFFFFKWSCMKKNIDGDIINTIYISVRVK